MAYSNLAHLRMLAMDDAAAQEWGTRALDLAVRLGDREVEIHALNNIGTAQYHAGRVAEGCELLERSLELALAGDAHEHVARAYTNLGYEAAAARRHGDALTVLTAGIAYCEDRDLDSWTRYMQALQVDSLGDTGAWDDALALASRLLALPNLAPISVIRTAAAAARIRLRRGEDASDWLALATGLAPGTRELQQIGPAAFAAAEQAWLADRVAETPGITAPVLELLASRTDPWLLGEALWWTSLAVPGTAPPPQVAEPYRLMLTGRWHEAAARWQELGSPVWRAYALGLAEDLEAAQQAVTILDGLGAGAAVEAVARTRQSRGLTLPRRPRAAHRERAGGLTGREFEILELLAEGLSTAEIASRLVLSTRTVEHHVSAVLHKLGEPTRARAVAAAGRLGLLGP